MASDNKKKTKISPITIQQYLAGVKYPLSKDDIVEAAEGNKAEDNVMSLLKKLPDQEYGSPTDISREIGKLQ